jgi:heme iron utilization protein
MSDPIPNPGTDVRSLMRRAKRCALGTLETDGAPYVSLAMVALDHDATPLLLLSDLADHTRNLKRDGRVSLLFDGTVEAQIPLAGNRATLQGTAERTTDERHRARYLARQTDAAAYADFRDFNFYRVRVERAHLVAGFGRIHWLTGTDVLLDTGGMSALAVAEPEIIAHMNGDHAEAIQLYATRLCGRVGQGWRLTGIDPEGCDLARGAETARVDFDAAVADAESARMALVRLVKQARAQLPS